MPPPCIRLPTVLSGTPTQLCLVTPGFVPNRFTMELNVESYGHFTLACLNDVFPHGLVMQEIIDYEDATGEGTLAVFHNPSIPWVAAARKTFVIVPITLLRDGWELGSAQLDFFGQLMEAYATVFPKNSFLIFYTAGWLK